MAINYRLIPTIGLILLLHCCLFSQSHNPIVPYRVLNHDGWEIPGLRYLETEFACRSSENILVDGYNVKKTVYFHIASKDDYSKRVDTSKYDLLPTIIILEDDSVSYVIRSYGTRKITRYESARGTFCFDVDVAPYHEDKRSGHGGAGPPTNRAFFDEDGDGKFESMEYSTFVMGDPNRWRLHVPKWARE